MVKSGKSGVAMSKKVAGGRVPYSKIFNKKTKKNDFSVEKFNEPQMMTKSR